jgi:hypothetical protein
MRGDPMTSTLTHPRPSAHPILIIVAAFVAAALVVVVLAFTVWGSAGSDVDVPAPRIESPTGTVRDPTAATQAYRDRLQELNSTLDGYSTGAVRAPSIDSGEAACDLTGPC